jgi:hypothetical protein
LRGAKRLTYKYARKENLLADRAAAGGCKHQQRSGKKQIVSRVRSTVGTAMFVFTTRGGSVLSVMDFRRIMCPAPASCFQSDVRPWTSVCQRARQFVRLANECARLGIVRRLHPRRRIAARSHHVVTMSCPRQRDPSPNENERGNICYREDGLLLRFASATLMLEHRVRSVPGYLTCEDAQRSLSFLNGRTQRIVTMTVTVLFHSLVFC